jgi:membrane fusion protein (multidrug efflux system)
VQIDATTDTIALRGTFPNRDGILIDRQFVVVVVQSKEPRSALVVPRFAVGNDQRGTFVLVVGDDNKVEQRVIKMGAQFGADVAVVDGLQVGDKVITDGLLKVRPGMQVNPSAAGPAQAQR